MTADRLDERRAALEAAFGHIARTRMAGLPLLQPGLRVQAVGLQPCHREPDLAWGVLVTPWFMNLVWLPLQASAAGALPFPGLSEPWTAPAGQTLDRLGAEEPGLGEGPWGRYALCSLRSPMQGLTHQDQAVALATEVLALLRTVAAAPDAAVAPAPGRRGFLFGRSASAAR